MVMDEYINDDDLRKMQLIQLEMLKEVDRICKKHSIKYSIIAGTLLGAVRHKGYIPWDDDADVAMLRKDYDKFVKISENELDKSKFYFQDHKNTYGYRWGYGKLRRKNTVFIRKGQEHMPYDSGVFIDIFPLDEVPNNKFKRKIYGYGCTCVRKMLWSEVGAKLEKNKYLRFMYKLIAKIPRDTVFKYYEKLKKVGSKNKSAWVRILTFPTPDNGEHGYRKKWYENLEDIEFEGYLFPAIKDYDEYLSFKFGNYLELPPIEQRKVHVASYYNFDQINL